jgi:pSer/pThr/pTyr-binding forkhead associated (FHA) protein
VIDDPRMSRHHLEIRVIREQFALFDLDSSGGTYVNGQRINQGILYPGDLISLASVNVVFTQDRLLSERVKTDPTTLGGHGKLVTAVFEAALRDKGKSENCK